MRSLSTLATLLVGLAIVFWAPTAKADCPHKDTNFDHKHCDSEVGGIGTLLDANGDTIGRVVSIARSAVPTQTDGSIFHVTILFEMSGHTFSAVVSGGFTRTRSRTSGFSYAGTVFFEDIDCEGLTWINAGGLADHGRNFFDEFQAATIVGEIATDPDERRLFHVAPGAVLNRIEQPSLLSLIATCGYPH